MSMRNREVKSLENFLKILHDPLISITQPKKRTRQFGPLTMTLKGTNFIFADILKGMLGPSTVNQNKK